MYSDDEMYAMAVREVTRIEVHVSGAGGALGYTLAEHKRLGRIQPMPPGGVQHDALGPLTFTVFRSIGAAWVELASADIPAGLDGELRCAGRTNQTDGPDCVPAATIVAIGHGPSHGPVEADMDRVDAQLSRFYLAHVARRMANEPSPVLHARFRCLRVPTAAYFAAEMVDPPAESVLEGVFAYACCAQGDMPSAFFGLAPARQAAVLARFATLFATTIEYVPDRTPGGAACNDYRNWAEAGIGDCEECASLAVHTLRWLARSASAALEPLRACLARYEAYAATFRIAESNRRDHHTAVLLLSKQGAGAGMPPALLEGTVRTRGVLGGNDAPRAKDAERPLTVNAVGLVNEWYEDVVVLQRIALVAGERAPLLPSFAVDPQSGQIGMPLGRLLARDRAGVETWTAPEVAYARATAEYAAGVVRATPRALFVASCDTRTLAPATTYDAVVQQAQKPPNAVFGLDLPWGTFWYVPCS
jgi:hypothetical protein